MREVEATGLLAGAVHRYSSTCQRRSRFGWSSLLRCPAHDDWTGQHRRTPSPVSSVERFYRLRPDLSHGEGTSLLEETIYIYLFRVTHALLRPCWNFPSILLIGGWPHEVFTVSLQHCRFLLSALLSQLLLLGYCFRDMLFCDMRAGKIGRLGLDRVLDCFSVSVCTNSCLCSANSVEDEDGFETKALIPSDQMIKLKEIFEGNRTLAFHLEPKTVVLKVSMHCHGCAKKVGKHISKMEGVTSFEVDLESKKVVVMGDITPFEVLESVSKVKFAELWLDP